MAVQAQYASVPKIGIATISTADTVALTGTPTAAGTVFTAGTSGSRIDKISIQALTNITTGIVRLWLYDGTNYKLWKEVLISNSYTTSNTSATYNTVLASTTVVDDLPLILPTGWSLRATTSIAQSFNIIARGGDI